MRVVYEFVLSRCRPKTVLFRGLPRCFASLVSRGFLCLRWAEKLNLFLSSSVFMGSFNSYELFIIPWRDSVIHNSGFSNSKYSLFIFVYSLFIIQLPHPNALKFFSVESLRVKLQFTIPFFLRTAVLRKLLDIRFSYKHCNFSRVCLIVKMASKTVTRLFELPFALQI